MIKRFIKKRINRMPIKVQKPSTENKVVEVKNNEVKKTEEDMIIPEQISQAQELVNDMINEPVVKKVKKDKGLMEKAGTDKVVLVEDNRQVLND